MAGEYAIVSYGYSFINPNGNKGRTNTGWSTDDGDGALSFVGGGLFGGTLGTTIGDTVDGGPDDRCAAGTFSFETAAPIPLPASLPLLAAAMGGLALTRRTRG